MNKKYELVEDDFILHEGRKLYRIRALKEVSRLVSKRDLGGYVEGYHNLSQEGECWVFNDAMVYGNARVKDSAIVDDFAEVYDNAVVSINAEVHGCAKIYNNAIVTDNAIVWNDTEIFGNAEVKAAITGRSLIYENAKLCDFVKVTLANTIDVRKEIKGNIVLKSETEI
jgi:NDP-sugar pyrophosphorylase family protein